MDQYPGDGRQQNSFRLAKRENNILFLFVIAQNILAQQPVNFL